MNRPVTIVCEICGGKFSRHSLLIHQKQCVKKRELSTSFCPVCDCIVSNDEYSSHVTECKRVNERAIREKKLQQQKNKKSAYETSQKGALAKPGSAGVKKEEPAPAQGRSKIPEAVLRRLQAHASGEKELTPKQKLEKRFGDPCDACGGKKAAAGCLGCNAVYCRGCCSMIHEANKGISSHVPFFAESSENADGSPPEDEDLPDARVECAVCSRKFDPARIAKHQLVCTEQSMKKKRKKFMSAQDARVKGTDFEKFVKSAREAEAKGIVAPEAPSKWRQEHEKIQAIATAGRDVASPTKTAPSSTAATSSNADTGATTAATTSTATTTATAIDTGANGEAVAEGVLPPPVVMNRNPKVGDRVYCLDKDRVGVLQFKGPVWGMAKGTWYGIEFHDGPYGNCDGSHKGVSYFYTQENHGLFTRPGRVRSIEGKGNELKLPEPEEYLKKVGVLPTDADTTNAASAPAASTPVAQAKPTPASPAPVNAPTPVAPAAPATPAAVPAVPAVATAAPVVTKSSPPKVAPATPAPTASDAVVQEAVPFKGRALARTPPVTARSSPPKAETASIAKTAKTSNTPPSRIPVPSTSHGTPPKATVTTTTTTTTAATTVAKSQPTPVSSAATVIPAVTAPASTPAAPAAKQTPSLLPSMARPTAPPSTNTTTTSAVASKAPSSSMQNSRQVRASQSSIPRIKIEDPTQRLAAAAQPWLKKLQKNQPQGLTVPTPMRPEARTSLSHAAVAEERKANAVEEIAPVGMIASKDRTATEKLLEEEKENAPVPTKQADVGSRPSSGAFSSSLVTKLREQVLAERESTGTPDSVLERHRMKREASQAASRMLEEQIASKLSNASSDEQQSGDASTSATAPEDASASNSNSYHMDPKARDVARNVDFLRVLAGEKSKLAAVDNDTSHFQAFRGGGYKVGGERSEAAAEAYKSTGIKKKVVDATGRITIAKGVSDLESEREKRALAALNRFSAPAQSTEAP